MMLDTDYDDSKGSEIILGQKNVHIVFGQGRVRRTTRRMIPVVKKMFNVSPKHRQKPRRFVPIAVKYFE